MAQLKAVVTEYQQLSQEWAKGKSRDSAKVCKPIGFIWVIIICYL